MLHSSSCATRHQFTQLIVIASAHRNALVRALKCNPFPFKNDPDVFALPQGSVDFRLAAFLRPRGQCNSRLRLAAQKRPASYGAATQCQRG